MPRVMYVVHVEVEPHAEAAWAAWQFGKHVPEVVREGNFVRARRFADEAPAPDGWKRHSIHYEAPDRATLEAYLKGEVIARLRAEHVEKFGATTRISRQILIEEGEPIRGTVRE
jgi:hypothetical protein